MKRPPHRPPPWYLGPREAQITERYQAEIDTSTARLEKRYKSAQKAVAKAQARIERAERQGASETTTKSRRIEFERRLAELAEIERLMQPANHASAEHRGDKSYRKVPR